MLFAAKIMCISISGAAPSTSHVVLPEFRRVCTEARGRSDPQTGSALQGQQPFVYHTNAADVNAFDGNCSLGKLTFTPQGLDAGCGGRV